MAKVKFIVKSKPEFANEFRQAFEKMGASFSESSVDADRTVIRFDVTCDADKTGLLQHLVPKSAYASVGLG